MKIMTTYCLCHPGHNCCSFCSKECESGECPLLPFDSMPSESTITTLLHGNATRVASEDHKVLVKDMLLEYHEAVCSKPVLLVPGEIVTGLSKIIIDDIILHLPFINPMQYIKDHLHVGSQDTCRELLLILNDVFRDIEVAEICQESEKMEMTDLVKADIM